jgi:hypothetical protein
LNNNEGENYPIRAKLRKWGLGNGGEMADWKEKAPFFDQPFAYAGQRPTGY